MRRLQLAGMVALFWMAGVISAWSSPMVSVSETATAVRLSNDYLERTIDFDGGLVKTTSFRNAISGSVYAVYGDEFQIKLICELWKRDADNPVTLTTHDFQMADRSIEDVGAGGKRLIFHLSQVKSTKPYLGIKVTLTYELNPLDSYTRKWIRIETGKLGTAFIDSVAVEANDWFPSSFSGGGFGQPLLGADMFFGLEHPSSLNTLQGSRMSLGYIVGLNIPKEGFTAESAVFGVSASGESHNAFMKYIDRIRMKPPHPFLTYSAFDSFPPVFGQEGVRADVNDLSLLISNLGTHLVTEQRVRLDSFMSDGGWDDLDNLWAFDPKHFPSGFRDLLGQLGKIDTGLGIWLGPDGGYGDTKQKRIETGARQGMEATANRQFFCMAGPNYSQFVKSALLRLEKDQDANFFKLDGIEFTCNDPSDGHPVGIYSREASVRVLIDILKALHTANPNVFLALSTGPWRSPWWLRYGETVDWGAGDFGYLDTVPSLTRRQSALSYNDAALYEIFDAEGTQFPMSSLDTDGLMKAKFNLLGGEHERLDDWKDAVVNLIGCAAMKTDLYITPDMLTKDEWDALGSTLRYIVKNAHPLYDNSTFVLGAPARREPYGFLHYSPAKTIVVLRNPFVRPTSVELKLDSRAGFERSAETYRAEVVFPYHEILGATFHYGDSLNLKLDGYEQSVIELHPVTDEGLEVTGARYSTLSSTNPQGQVTLRFYGETGESKAVSLIHAEGVKEFRIGGVKVEPKSEANASLVSLHFGKGDAPAEEPSFSAASTRTQGTGTGRTVTLSTTVTVPGDFRESQLAILLEPTQPMDRVTANARINGAVATVTSEEGKKGVWYWFKCDLQAGRNSVDVNLTLPAESSRTITISGWLRGKRQLASTDLTLVFQPGQTPVLPSDKVLPSNSDLERKTYKVFEQIIN